MQDREEKDPEPSEDGVAEEGRRPTPVRMAMEGGEEEKPEGEENLRMIREEETGVEWVVSVSGHSASGVLPLRTVSLMELNFAKADAPDRPLRRAVCSGGDLAEVSSQELLAVLKSSGPFTEPLRGSPEDRGSSRRGKYRRNRRG